MNIVFIMGKQRERERREREREREREYLAASCYLHKNEKKLHHVFTRQFSRVLTPRPKLSRFFTGISRRRYVLLRRLCLSWGNVFPHRESTSWNFPAKIKNSLLPIPSFDMMSKFPGSDHSCRRRYVNKLFGGKKE